MVLDPNRNWIRVKCEPTDSVRIVQGGVTNPLFGEIEAGTPIPQGFRVVAQIPKGWSKERCVLCDAEIGPRHQPFGYRDQRDAKGGLNSAGYWVCERDYQQFVSRHDLGFLLT